MDQKEISEAIRYLEKLRHHIEHLEAQPNPDLCGVCLKPFRKSDGRAMYMEEDSPFKVAHHFDCGNLISSRERVFLLAELYHGSSGFRRRWLKKKFDREREAFARTYIRVVLENDIKVDYYSWRRHKLAVGEEKYNQIRREVIESLIACGKAPQSLVEYWEKNKEKEVMD